MNLQQEKISEVKRILASWVKVVLLGFVVVALVTLPYRFDPKKGSYASSVVLAEDGSGDSGDHDGAGDSDGDHDGDHDSDGSGHDIGDDHDDGDDDGDDHDDSHDADHAGDVHDGVRDDSDDRYKGSNSIGGIEALTPVSSDEEAGLVGNWGDSSNK